VRALSSSETSEQVLTCGCRSGNTYSFLAHYRMTGSLKSLYRAIKFAEFTLDPANVSRMRVPDQPYSLCALPSSVVVGWCWLGNDRRADARACVCVCVWQMPAATRARSRCTRT
jgi:hypothetical protein